jgi:hypothetical protein
MACFPAGFISLCMAGVVPNLSARLISLRVAGLVSRFSVGIIPLCVAGLVARFLAGLIALCMAGVVPNFSASLVSLRVAGLVSRFSAGIIPLVMARLISGLPAGFMRRIDLRNGLGGARLEPGVSSASFLYLVVRSAMRFLMSMVMPSKSVSHETPDAYRLEGRGILTRIRKLAGMSFVGGPGGL